MSGECQSKRLLANTEPTREGAPNHYLETVPDEILRVFLRFLSERPQSRNWHHHTSVLSVSTVIDVGGALARAASLEFRRIGGTDGVPFNAASDASTLRSLVHRLALHRLVLKLDREVVLLDLLRGCGTGLKELVLYRREVMYTEAEILAIATHCTNLSSLAIHGYRFEGTLAPIWRSLGSTLTRIYLCYYDLDIISVPDLLEHCVSLRHLDAGTFFRPLTNVIVELGSRIRVLSIRRFDVESIAVWREVYTACTNLEAVHLTLESSWRALDIIALVRPKLVSLALPRLNRLISAGDELFSVLSACPLLEKVEFQLLELVSEELLRKLFKSLKSVTTVTHYMRRYDEDLNKCIVDAISCNLTNLESLTLSIDMLLKAENANALADLPHLRFLKLERAYSNMRGSTPEEYAIRILKRLKDCARLEQLEIDYWNLKYSPLIAEAAVAYKRREFDMFICGVQYRTW